MGSGALQFEDVFAREILVAERAKAGSVAALFALLSAALTLVLITRARELDALSAHADVRFLVPAVVACGAIYQLANRALLGRALRRGTQVAAWVRYVSAFLEITLPSVVLVIVAHMVSPAEALSSPALLAYAPFLALSSMRLDALLCAFSGAVAAGEYLLLAGVYHGHDPARFSHSLFETGALHIGRALLLLSAGVAAAFVAREIRRRILASLATVEERNRVVGVFGRYVTDEVASVLLRSPDALELGGEKREITLMMTDLRGFSNLASTLEPEAVVRMLNHYLGAMTSVIVDHGGTIDEFIGDAIFVLFGAPLAVSGHADRGVACGLAMQNAMGEVNAWNAAHGHPSLEMGIGIHTGEVILGNIGSEKRSKYGVIGSHVNLTSRIESYTVGGQLLVSQSTRDRLTADARIDGELIVEPKGAKGPVTLFDIGGLGAPFDLSLEKRASELAALRPAIEVRWRVLHGKDLGGEAASGQLVRLGDGEAELASRDPAPLLSNLRIELVNAEGVPAGDDLLGKVIARDGELGAMRVRFTAQGPESRRVLESALADRARPSTEPLSKMVGMT